MMTRLKSLAVAAALALSACTSAQLAIVNTDISDFETALSADVTAVSSTVAADFTTASKVYASLTGTGGACAPGAPAPANATAVLAELVTQVKAIQAALKPASS